MSKVRIIVGTRTSKLALWQTNHVGQLLREVWPNLQFKIEPFQTKGDKTLDKPLPEIGGKGLFTAELEEALRAGTIDIAVHSLKDLPTDMPPDLILGAITSRADVRDVLVSDHGYTLETLPQNAVVGTSSQRRKAQLLAIRPDLEVRSIRGNVPTRIKKVMTGDYDAAVLALAGVQRLGLMAEKWQTLPLETMLPAPGQGALAIQCRRDDVDTLKLLRSIEEGDVRTAVTAERTFLQELGGGCSAPIAAYATVMGNTIQLKGLVGSEDGKRLIRVEQIGQDARFVGARAAHQAMWQGANEILQVERPLLLGQRIVITRSHDQASEMRQKLTELGAHPIVIPSIKIEAMPDTKAIDEAIWMLDSYHWLIFTSANAVDIFWNRLTHVGQDPAIVSTRNIAAVGPATAKALAHYDIRTDFMPDVFVADEIVEGLGDIAGKRILWPRGLLARKQLTDGLVKKGAGVQDIPIYRTVAATIEPEGMMQLSDGVDIITFMSSSAVENFVMALGEVENGRFSPLLRTATLAAIGPITAEAIEKQGLTPHIIGEPHTADGLIQAIVDHLNP